MSWCAMLVPVLVKLFIWSLMPLCICAQLPELDDVQVGEDGAEQEE